MNYFIIIIMLLILLIVVTLNITKEGFQSPPSNGYTEACNELDIKRTILKDILNNLRTNVQDISANLINSYNFKRENMSYQKNYTTYCINNLNTNEGCKILASTDKYPLYRLPDLDIFYYNVLYGSYDIQNLLNRLNYYSDLIQCTRNPSTFATKDVSDNQLDVARDIGDIDTTSLFLELQKLSPYYLSPDVIGYILRFLISKEKLNELKYTSSDYVRNFGTLTEQIIDRLT
jgi:hypothetical protein